MHPDGGWGEGVVGGKEESAPVLAVVVGGRRWAGQDVVPFQDVGLGRVSDNVGRRVGLDGGVFSVQLL